MIARARFVFFALIGLGAAGVAAEVPLAARVERLRGDVARLAGDSWQGRRAGSKGADRAASWLAAEFRRLGLRPGAADGSFFQTFTFIDGVVLGPGNGLSVGAARFAAGEDFRPLAFSAAGSFEGEAAFAGYGIVAKDDGYDDYAGLDVAGRVVLILRYGPGGDDPHSKWAAFTPLRLKVATARERGAAAVLVVSGPLTPDGRDELVPLRADTSLVDAGIPAFSVRRALAEALFARSGADLAAAQRSLDETGRPAPRSLGVRVTGVADVTPKRATTRNVVAIAAPAASTAETIVVGAHYDHLGLGQSHSLDPAAYGKVHHGADDNASGVAALVELARALAPRAAGLRRSVHFLAFGAEELGVLGSSHFVKDPPLPLERVAAMVNMDMIGRLRETIGLDVHGVGTSAAWKPLIEAANRRAGLKLNFREGGYGPSDHSPFYAAGRPVLFVFTGAHADYHRPSDTADRIDALGIARVLQIVEPVVTALAESSEPVVFTRVAADKEAGGSASRGFRVFVGGVPDYSHEGPGVRFSGVSPGSPAEQAGIRGGDVLVRFASREIRDIYDYTRVLGEHKPGDRVDAVLQRDAGELTLTITLAARPSAAR